MSTYRVTYGTDVHTVTLGQPESQIRVDGRAIGIQCADGSCRAEACIRLALEAVYPEPVEWDDVAYEAV